MFDSNVFGMIQAQTKTNAFYFTPNAMLSKNINSFELSSPVRMIKFGYDLSCSPSHNTDRVKRNFYIYKCLMSNEMN